MLAEAQIPTHADPLPSDRVATLLTAPTVTETASPVVTAIRRHKLAWAAYQAAPEGEPSVLANEEMSEALDAVLDLRCRTLSEADALLVHLRWWTDHEASIADSFGDPYSHAVARADELALLLGSDWEDDAADPIFGLVARLDALRAAYEASPFREAVGGTPLGDALDDEIDRTADHETFLVFKVLRSQPKTSAGLQALLRFASERYDAFHLMAGVPDVFSVIAEATRNLALNEAAPERAATLSEASTQNPRS